MELTGLPPGELFLLDEASGFVVLKAGARRVAVVFCDEPGDRVCEQIRRLAPAFPVVVVYGRASPARVEEVLAAGASECVPLGADIAGLVARLSLNAGGPDGVPAGGAVRLTDCGLAVGDREFRLTPAEYRVVQMLWAARGRTVAHAELERAVYGRASLAERQAVRQAIYRLRARLGPLGRVVETVPGFGYRLREEVPPEPDLLSTCYGPVMAS